MSKIDEMLKNEKVEWKKLGEVCEISTGKSNTNEKVNDGKYPFYVRSKDIKRSNTFEYDETAIIIPGEGGIGDIFHYVQGKYALHQRAYRIHLIEEELNSKFIYYYIVENFKCFIQRHAVSATVSSIRKPMIENFLVPIPSLNTQEKIVKTLDKFTNYLTALQSELQSELQSRNRQYEYYRDKLLSEEYLNKLISNYDLYKYELKETTLGELCDIRNGYTPSKSNKEYWENGETPWFRMEDIRLNGNILNDSTIKVNKIAIKNSLFKRNSIILSTSATIGEHALIEVDFLANQRFTVFTVKNEFERLINFKFFYYYFYVIGNLCKKYLKLGNFASVDIDKLKNSKIFIPPIEIQEKIVEILDKFQALTQDVSGLLPNEIEKREKQYEYYREKLLTFDTERTRGGTKY